MRGMILAAGYGERLWPLTADRTKPAIPVLGKPLVGYVAEYLARFGIRDVAVNLHHRPESVRRALGDGSQFGVKLEYFYEPQILGTSGAWDNARDFLIGETFVVINGKVITDIDLNATIQQHQDRKALATLVLKTNRARERFSIVEVEKDFVKGFRGMPTTTTTGSPLMFTGIQILEPRIFDYVPRGAFSHSTVDVYPQAIARGEKIMAYVADGMWHELSTLQRYLDISLALLRPNRADVCMGFNSRIEPGARVSDSVLWDQVVVESEARVRRVVLADGVRIPSGQQIDDAVVVRAELIAGSKRPAKALPGEIRGDNFVVPLSQ